MTAPTYRIRPCNGDKESWCLVLLRNGEESLMHGDFVTSRDLNWLVKQINPGPGTRVELVL